MTSILRKEKTILRKEKTNLGKEKTILRKEKLSSGRRGGVEKRWAGGGNDRMEANNRIRE